MEASSPEGPGREGQVRAPRAAIRTPLWFKASALATLVLALGSLLAAVDVGVGGNVPFSNALAVVALLAMGAFSVLNLWGVRRLSTDAR